MTKLLKQTLVMLNLNRKINTEGQLIIASPIFKIQDVILLEVTGFRTIALSKMEVHSTTYKILNLWTTKPYFEIIHGLSLFCF